MNKRRILLGALVLGATVALSMFHLLGSAGAATTGTVEPSVTVSSTLSVALEDVAKVQWGAKPAGTTQTGAIQARVTSNANWTLYVRRTSDIGIACGLVGEDGTNHINSAAFTYSSASGTPAPPAGNGVTATQFDTSDTNVWAVGAPTIDCRVAVTYSLVIPGNQLPQGYSATHTYTVVSS